MKSSARNSLIFGLTVGCSVFYGSSSYACCVAYDYSDASKNKEQVITQLTDRLNAVQLAIIEAMRLGTGQLSGNLKENLGASSNIANVQDDRSVTGRVEDKRLSAITAAASGVSSCNVITGANAGALLPSSSKAYSAQTSTDAVNWSLGVGQPSQYGTEVAVESTLKAHCADFATSDDTTSGLCASASSNPGVDVDVSKNIYYSASGTDSETLDELRTKAAIEFMTHVINPRPLGGSMPGEGKQSGGRLMIAKKLSDAARMSIAQDYTNDLIARRQPLSSSDASSWAQAMAQQMKQQLTTPSGNTSEYDWMAIRAKGWFLNPNWGVAMDTANESQVMKDVAMILAYQTYLQWKTYQLLEKQGLILSGILSTDVEAHRQNP